MIKNDYAYWENIFGNFECEFSSLAKDAVGWYPAGYHEIGIQFRDGRRANYNPLLSSKRLRFVYNPKVGVDDILTEDEWAKTFGNNIYRRMKSTGITGENLSDITGISRVSISKYLNGNAIPNTRNSVLIAKALKCTINELVPEFNTYYI